MMVGMAQQHHPKIVIAASAHLPARKAYAEIIISEVSGSVLNGAAKPGVAACVYLYASCLLKQIMEQNVRRSIPHVSL